ncbi:alkylmercury lyase [Streptomyces polyrhachis]|uniref:Alkylmercury lyase n=1 Tax=Streptomyces polyrhachis TaxID=1282885 RepID=A0ABW2G818_9ACTN
MTATDREDEAMRITVLAVPGCANTGLALERVAAALAGRAAEVEVVEVRNGNQALALGMSGSPTILLDGVDPFPSDGGQPSVSCRLYRDADGAASGAPGEDALRAAINAACASGG